MLALFKMARRSPVQLSLPQPPRPAARAEAAGPWGGRRPGAGRPRARKFLNVPHRARPLHKAAHPVHLTLRLRRGLPSLREQGLYRALERAIGAARRSPTGLRIVHFSVQLNHLHFLVEAPHRDALCRGAKGLAIRLARAINAFLGIAGRVWGDRYHVQELESPRRVRNALVYVLLNWKKHVHGAQGIDPCSSGATFDGWRYDPSEATLDGWRHHLLSGPAPGATAGRPSLGGRRDDGPPLVHRPRTWLLSTGWRLQGTIARSDSPRSAALRSGSHRPPGP
jgi:putative transposase